MLSTTSTCCNVTVYEMRDSRRGSASNFKELLCAVYRCVCCVMCSVLFTFPCGSSSTRSKCFHTKLTELISTKQKEAVPFSSPAPLAKLATRRRHGEHRVHHKIAQDIQELIFGHLHGLAERGVFVDLDAAVLSLDVEKTG